VNRYALVTVTGPAIEPVTLAEAKEHIRLSSGSFADSVSTVRSIVPAAHQVTPDYGLVGSSVEVLGYRVVVNLDVGTVPAEASVTAKLQESADEASWTDVVGGSFGTVTSSGLIELAYTGTARYVRVAATVAGSAVPFGASVVRHTADATEDSLITGYIRAAREKVEAYLGRTLITTVYDLVLDDWPGEPYITLPRPPLQSVSSVKHYGTDNTEHIMSSEDYTVDTSDNFGGILFLRYGKSWPTTTLRPYRGVKVRFAAGYGDAASAVPQYIRDNIKVLVAAAYGTRGEVDERLLSALSWPDRKVGA